MKIVHINTYDSGGAFVAGYRFHQEMLRQGVESKFLVLKKSSNLKDIIEYIRTSRSIWVKASESIKYRIISTCFKVLKRFTPNDVGFTSVPFTAYDINRLQFIREADIIHLHFIANFISIRRIAQLSKPIFWTLHDISAFSGIQHYGNISNSKINDLIKSYKLRLLEKINLICPSNWMYNELKKNAKSNLQDGYCGVIHNGIKNNKTSSIKRRIDKSIKIGFVSASLSDFRKGVDFFPLIVEKLSELKLGIEIHVVGNNDLEEQSSELINYHGFLETYEMSRFYQKIDLLLVLSRNDNLPNVMLEAMAHAIPSIAFDIGGVEDLIIDKNLLIAPFSITNFIDKIVELVNNPKELAFYKVLAYDKCMKHFDIESQTRKHLQVYERVHQKVVTNS